MSQTPKRNWTAKFRSCTSKGHSWDEAISVRKLQCR